MFSELTLMLKPMTSLSSRLPAYFVIPTLLPEENVPRFQGHGIPVSASGNLTALACSSAHLGKVFYLKPVALVLKSLSSVQE